MGGKALGRDYVHPRTGGNFGEKESANRILARYADPPQALGDPWAV